MPTIAPQPTARLDIVTEPQRRLERTLRDLAARVVRHCRAAAGMKRRAARASELLDSLDQRHPDFKVADIREAVRYWKFLAAISAAFVLDAVLAGPVGEYIVLTFLQMSTNVARIARYALPAALLVTEMGIARLRVAPDRRMAETVAANGLALALVVVMPLLVGETVMVEQGGLLNNRPNALVIAMMLLTFCVHSFVLFTGEAQVEAMSYAIYRWRAGALTSEKTRSGEGAQRQANLAGDLFADWVANRDMLIRRYPGSAVPQPHWGAETIDAINGAYGYNAIQPPPFAAQAGRPADDPGTRPATGEDQAAPTPRADDLRDAHDRRVRESEAEVVAD